MIRQRVRIRFRKHSDLRLIGHRDLVRTFERLFRRAGLSLSMTEGFHPKAKMNFPSALALGIEGNQEVMELELAHRVTDSVTEILRRHAPPGLSIIQVEPQAENAPKARIRRVVYEMDVPKERRSDATRAIIQLLSRSSVHIRRSGRSEPIDLLAGLESLELVDGVIRFAQSVSRTVSARPRELVEALGIVDLESHGYWLRRTSVELAQ